MVGIDFFQRRFTAVAEGCVTEIVPKGNRFGQILVESEGPGNVARHLCDFERMGQSGPILIAQRGEKYLGFVFQPSECIGEHDPIAINLKGGAN
jgi:hypothetical protein